MTLPLIENVRKIMKFRKGQVLISQVISLIYAPYSGGQAFSCEALVASAEFMESMERKEGELVYVHQGSQNGVLALMKIEKRQMEGFPERDMSGTYDRDDRTGLITSICLSDEKVFSLAYFGNIGELLANPNIKRY